MLCEKLCEKGQKNEKKSFIQKASNATSLLSSVVYIPSSLPLSKAYDFRRNSPKQTRQTDCKTGRTKLHNVTGSPTALRSSQLTNPLLTDVVPSYSEHTAIRNTLNIILNRIFYNFIIQHPRLSIYSQSILVFNISYYICFLGQEVFWVVAIQIYVSPSWGCFNVIGSGG